MSEWKEYKVSDLCHGIYDGPYATPEKTNHGPIFLGISNLCSGRIDLSDVDHLSEESFKKWTRRITPQANDVVFSYETRLGEAALIPDGLRCCLGRRMALMRPNLEKVDPQFLLYVYLFPAFQETITARTIYGSTVNRIALIEFPSYPIKVPSLKIQKSISSILYNIDAKIDNLRRQNETLEEVARSIFKHWFIDFEFPNADGKPYKSSGGVMVRSDLGDIPEGWRVGNIKDIMTLNYGKSLIAENRTKGKYPVIGSNGIVDTHNDFFVTAPGIVIGRKGTIGKVIWIEENFYPIDTTFYIQDILGCDDLHFHYFVLKNQNFSRLTSDSAVPGLNRDMAYSVDLVIPPIEQINKYNFIAKAIFNKVSNNTNQIQTLTKTRDTLLPKLMSGQLRVNE
jgi:type I restriction enzyme, S subunit